MTALRKAVVRFAALARVAVSGTWHTLDDAASSESVIGVAAFAGIAVAALC